MICDRGFSTLEQHERAMCLPIAEGVQNFARWCRGGVDTVEHVEGVGVVEGSSAVVERWLSDASVRRPVVLVSKTELKKVRYCITIVAFKRSYKRHI